METLKNENVELRKFVCGAQAWEPECEYDAFWVQWVIMYLTDADAIAFLLRCKAKLKPGGIIFVKDNLATDDFKTDRTEAQFFEDDRGVCRSYCRYIELFQASGLKVLETVKQEQWPTDMLPLYTFILR
jgi:protein N-terminal methyltransferase